MLPERLADAAPGLRRPVCGNDISHPKVSGCAADPKPVGTRTQAGAPTNRKPALNIKRFMALKPLKGRIPFINLAC